MLEGIMHEYFLKYGTYLLGVERESQNGTHYGGLRDTLFFLPNFRM